MAEISGRTPPALAARPEVAPSLGVYVEAFNLLSALRPAGLAGAAPIPLSEIESYCRLFGWTGPEEVAELIEILLAMEAVHREVTAEPVSRQVQSSGPKERQAGRP